MTQFIRRRLLWFLIGFVGAFLVYLFVKYGVNEVLRGVSIAIVAGIVFSLLMYYLERRSAAQPDGAVADPQQK